MEILVGLPAEWSDYVLSRWEFTPSDLTEAIEQRRSNGVDIGSLVNVLLALATKQDDAEALEWLVDHEPGPEGTTAFAALGALLVNEAKRANASVPLTSEEFDERAALDERIKHWLERAQSEGVHAETAEELDAVATQLHWQQARQHGIDLHNSLAACFEGSVSELASWHRSVGHLMRRCEEWLEDHRFVTQMHDVITPLSGYVSWVKANGRQWGDSHMVPTGFGPGQVPPAFDGSCRNCASLLSGHRFCTQCGSTA